MPGETAKHQADLVGPVEFPISVIRNFERPLKVRLCFDLSMREKQNKS